MPDEWASQHRPNKIYQPAHSGPQAPTRIPPLNFLFFTVLPDPLSESLQRQNSQGWLSGAAGERSLLTGACRLALGARIPLCPPYPVQSSPSAGVTGPVIVDSQGERLMDYFIYALQKSGNGSLFLPFLQYDSSQKVIR